MNNIHGVKGAITSENNSVKSIMDASAELLDTLIKKNKIIQEDVAAVFFTTSPDLNAEFSDVPHDKATLSMARSSDPNSANSQFFICFEAAPFLDRNYTVFGKVVEGFEYVEKIIGTGLYRTYITIAEETPTIKGRLLLAKNIRSPLSIKLKPWCEYDELSFDVIENRCILYCADLLLSAVIDDGNKQKLVTIRNLFLNQNVTLTPINSYELDAQIILSDIIGVKRESFIINNEINITEKIAEKYDRAIKRRINREPVAYITGKKEFWSEDFNVNKSTLIPRPETELLIYKVVNFFKNKKINILDIGTGSGCILLSILKELNYSRGIGIDISTKAIKTARVNSKKFNLLNRSKFKIFDITSFNIGKYDLIVSNPPYIVTHHVVSAHQRGLPGVRGDRGSPPLFSLLHPVPFPIYNRANVHRKQHFSSNIQPSVQRGFRQEQW